MSSETHLTPKEKQSRYRSRLRRKGLRPVQIWVPDTRRPGFGDECRRQSRIAFEADRIDSELDAFMDAALIDLAYETGK